MGKETGFKTIMVALILCGVFLFAGPFIWCDTAFSQEEEELVQSHENPMSRTVQQGRMNVGRQRINTGDGPGGEKPTSALQQTRPTRPVQALRPTKPIQHMRPTRPKQTMRPTRPVQ